MADELGNSRCRPTDEVRSPSLAMLVCDLDGTLLTRDSDFAPADVDALRALEHDRVIRVIATGRALATAHKVLPREFPIDYLVFSSGAGILDWQTQQLLTSHALAPQDTEAAVQTFMRHEIDFMLHEPIPDQHIFLFHRTGKANADFERRLDRYAQDGRVLRQADACRAASQLIGISPTGDPHEPFATLQRELPQLSIIRATSPLDGKSMWIEAFAREVSKSQAAQWIARRRGVGSAHTYAIGNDYNDWDLLRWATHAAVVQNAPAVMRSEFTTVSSLAGWLNSMRA